MSSGSYSIRPIPGQFWKKILKKHCNVSHEIVSNTVLEPPGGIICHLPSSCSVKKIHTLFFYYTLISAVKCFFKVLQLLNDSFLFLGLRLQDVLSLRGGVGQLHAQLAAPEPGHTVRRENLHHTVGVPRGNTHPLHISTVRFKGIANRVTVTVQNCTYS